MNSTPGIPPPPLFVSPFSPLGGYKGAGLAFMVEILCGVLAGATYGPHVRWWSMAEEQAGDLVRSGGVSRGNQSPTPTPSPPWQ